MMISYMIDGQVWIIFTEQTCETVMCVLLVKALYQMYWKVLVLFHFCALWMPDPVTFLGPSVCVTDSRQIGMRDGLGEVNFRRNSLKDMY